MLPKKKEQPKQTKPVSRYNPKVFKADSASQNLQRVISEDLGKEVSVHLITGLSKIHGIHPIPADSKILKRISDSKGLISTKTMSETLSQKETFTKGTPLSDESIKRIHKGFCDSDGKLSFEYIVKMGE